MNLAALLSIFCVGLASGAIPSLKQLLEQSAEPTPLSGEGFGSDRRACKKGAVYTIKSADDLRRHEKDLECIFAAAEAPSTVPIGPHYGEVLRLTTNEAIASVIANLWKGKLAFMSRCYSSEWYGALNIVLGKPRIPALLSLGFPDVRLAPGEYDDGKPSFLIDYSQDFSTVCPAVPHAIYDSRDFSLNVLNDVFPFNLVVDVVRIAGRLADGGILFIGKSFARDYFSESQLSYTIAFWATISYDTSLVVNMKPGDSLPPLANSFTYKELSLGAFVAKTIPVGGLLTRPVFTLGRYFELVEAFATRLHSRFGVLLHPRSPQRTRGTRSINNADSIKYVVGLLASDLASNPAAENIEADKIADTLLNAESLEAAAPKEGGIFSRVFARGILTSLLAASPLSPLLGGQGLNELSDSNVEAFGTSMELAMELRKLARAERKVNGAAALE